MKKIWKPKLTTHLQNEKKWKWKWKKPMQEMKTKTKKIENKNIFNFSSL